MYTLGVGELDLARLGRGGYPIEQVGVIVLLGADSDRRSCCYRR